MKRILFRIMTVAILTVACAREMPVSEPEPPVADLSEISEPGLAYIKFDEETAASIENETADGRFDSPIGVISMERVFPYAGEFEARTREAGLHRWYKVTFDKNVSLTKAQSDLKDMNGACQVRPVLKMKPADIPFNDPYADRLWNLDNNRGTDINVTSVWGNCTAGSPEVIVAVVDEGVMLDHEDLAGNTVPAGQNGSYCFVSKHTGPEVTGDMHGTHVAGTIAAVNGNGIGICGVAGGDASKGQPGVKIMSCQVFYTEGETTSQGEFASAIKWAADHGAVICNNSWGVDLSDLEEDEKIKYARETHEFFSNPNSGKFSDPVKDAIDYFNSYAGIGADGEQTGPVAGGVVVFSAGNDALQYGGYAAYPGVIAVGASTIAGKRASYSNYGNWVDIAAPGGTSGNLIWSCIPSTDGKTSSYAGLAGTSMAAPHVSGVAALIASYSGGPGFTREMLIDRLVKGADNDILPTTERIGPLANAYRSVSYNSGGHPVPPSDYTATATSNSISFSWYVNKDDGGNMPDTYKIFACTDRAVLEATDPSDPGESVIWTEVKARDADKESKLTATITKLDFETDYYVALASRDFLGVHSGLSVIKTVRTGENHEPVIDFPESGEFSLHAYEHVYVHFNAYDPDPGQNVAVEYSSVAGTDHVTKQTDGSFILTINGAGAKSGTYRSTIIARDDYGASSSFGISFTIKENTAPVIVKPFDDLLLSVGDTYTFNSAEYIYDPDGETLLYEIPAEDISIADIMQTDNLITVTPTVRDGYGFTTIHLSATDAGGEKTGGSFRLAVRPKDVHISVYPNPVSSVLNVGTGETPAQASIRILSAGGATVLEQTVSCSVFDPASVDMSGIAPGRYTVEVSYGGTAYRQYIVKI